MGVTRAARHTANVLCMHIHLLLAAPTQNASASKAQAR